MKVKHKVDVTADHVLRDRLFESLSSPPTRVFVARQLKDARLRSLNLDAIVEMDFEDLIHNLFVDSAQADALSDEQDEDLLPDDEGSPISISLDSMAVKATITLRKPASGPAPTAGEMRRALRDRGICEGIRDEFIIRLAEHPIYGQRFRIAEGVMPHNGNDGSAIFHFDQNKSLSLDPTMGHTDFDSMDFAEYVHQGDLLCELVPPTTGKPGRSVMGDVLPGANGVPSPIKAGTNAAFSEDGSKIYAACDGQVFFKNNRVGVSRVMVLDQVDQDTGNILFVGSVLIRGDVEDGRLVQAGGNITVCGHVKNAKLAAGRNLILLNGITGSAESDSLISAEGSIRARFIENARVKAGVNLYADSIMNAHVDCGGHVLLTGKYGRLVGGECHAGMGVTAMQIGNRASIPTAIYIKKDTESGAHLELQARLARFEETLTLLDRISGSITHSGDLSSEQLAALVRIVYLKRQISREIRDLQMELEEPKLGGASPGNVTATAVLFADVRIEIYGIVMTTTYELGSCTILRGGEKLHVSEALSSDSDTLNEGT